MRGFIHHIDLTVTDPWASAPFYDAVLGFMGYRRSSEDAHGIDWEHATAWIAESRKDVDELHALLTGIGAAVLDPPTDYPEYGAGYYAVMFADPDGLKLEFVHEPRV